MGARAAFLRQPVLRLSIRDVLCLVGAVDPDDYIGKCRGAARGRRAVSRAVARWRQRLSDEPAQAGGGRSEHAGSSRSSRQAARPARHATRAGNRAAVNTLHPIVRDWFAEHFGSATEPQARAWPAIRSGENVLISAPTGSGKTLAAFLICLDDLVRDGLDGSLPETTQVLYVSPLKALSNDIHKNLDVPLSGIASLAGRRALMLPAIRTAVRTGDTPTSERQRMVKHPPH